MWFRLIPPEVEINGRVHLNAKTSLTDASRDKREHSLIHTLSTRHYVWIRWKSVVNKIFLWKLTTWHFFLSNWQFFILLNYVSTCHFLKRTWILGRNVVIYWNKKLPVIDKKKCHVVSGNNRPLAYRNFRGKYFHICLTRHIFLSD